MEQNQNSKKRRLVDQNVRPNLSTLTTATQTECYKPMHLNVWTQTEFEPSMSTMENELKERIFKLEQKLKTHGIILSELTSRNVQKDEENNSEPVPSFKYKIVSEGHDIQLEPIVVEYAGDENVVYYEETITDGHINNINEEHHKCEDSSTISNLQYNHHDHQNHSTVIMKQDIESHYSSRSQSPKQKQTSWNNVESGPIPIQINSNTSIDNADTPTLTSTTAAATLPSIFNHFRPVSISHLQKKQLIPNNHENNVTCNQNVHQSDDTFECTSNIRNENHQEHISSDTQNLSTISNANFTSINKTKSEYYNSNPNCTSENFKTSRPRSVESDKVNSSSPNTTVAVNYSQHQDYINIGPNNTRIPLHIYDGIDWNSSASATRKLLTAVFDRITLATHSLTGKPSPAFHDRQKPSKKQLDPNIISDVVYVVSRKCNVAEREVRSAITTKCADENKMLRQRERKKLNDSNKENVKNNRK